MAQFGRPNSDVSTVSGDGLPVSTPNLYLNINEVSAENTDFIWTESGVNTSLIFGVSHLVDPQVSPGHIIRWRQAKGNNSSPLNDQQTCAAAVALYQGTTLIAQSTDQTLGAEADHEFTVPELNTGLITDYSQLRLHFIRSGNTGGSPSKRRGGICYWLELEIPDTSEIAPKNDGMFFGAI